MFIFIFPLCFLVKFLIQDSDWSGFQRDLFLLKIFTIDLIDGIYLRVKRSTNTTDSTCTWPVPLCSESVPVGPVHAAQLPKALISLQCDQPLYPWHPLRVAVVAVSTILHFMLRCHRTLKGTPKSKKLRGYGGHESRKVGLNLLTRFCTRQQTHVHVSQQADIPCNDDDNGARLLVFPLQKLPPSPPARCRSL